ncbi:unnamed protein product [Vitrella brassicaformis CCMP3155]|uniref:PH domain-containing protein n=1 Tax=Vitrella brassicaformis (strain CCMP3155) TaxID=1169540 RepID=A0A0G4EF90_VITBC|nr:unnamed protein product [Vitrella brassicaformis CCMP3155]|eukprot:CEL94189.1 unnamed protein product [Vitrella brassicaformis CCMP3155]
MRVFEPQFRAYLTQDRASPVEHYGYLLEYNGQLDEGGEAALRDPHQWQKRWFHLKGNLLFVCDSHTQLTNLACLLLEGCQISKKDLLEEEHPYGLSFEWHDDAIQLFSLSDQPNDRDAWFAALERCTLTYCHGRLTSATERLKDEEEAAARLLRENRALTRECRSLRSQIACNRQGQMVRMCDGTEHERLIGRVLELEQQLDDIQHSGQAAWHEPTMPPPPLSKEQLLSQALQQSHEKVIRLHRICRNFTHHLAPPVAAEVSFLLDNISTDTPALPLQRTQPVVALVQPITPPYYQPTAHTLSAEMQMPIYSGQTQTFVPPPVAATGPSPSVTHLHTGSLSSPPAPPAVSRQPPSTPQWGSCLPDLSPCIYPREEAAAAPEALSFSLLPQPAPRNVPVLPEVTPSHPSNIRQMMAGATQEDRGGTKVSSPFVDSGGDPESAEDGTRSDPVTGQPVRAQIEPDRWQQTGLDEELEVDKEEAETRDIRPTRDRERPTTADDHHRREPTGAGTRPSSPPQPKRPAKDRPPLPKSRPPPKHPPPRTTAPDRPATASSPPRRRQDDANETLVSRPAADSDRQSMRRGDHVEGRRRHGEREEEREQHSHEELDYREPSSEETGESEISQVRHEGRRPGTSIRHEHRRGEQGREQRSDQDSQYSGSYSYGHPHERRRQDKRMQKKPSHPEDEPATQESHQGRRTMADKRTTAKERKPSRRRHTGPAAFPSEPPALEHMRTFPPDELKQVQPPVGGGQEFMTVHMPTFTSLLAELNKTKKPSGRDKKEDKKKTRKESPAVVQVDQQMPPLLWTGGDEQQAERPALPSTPPPALIQETQPPLVHAPASQSWDRFSVRFSPTDDTHMQPNQWKRGKGTQTGRADVQLVGVGGSDGCVWRRPPDASGCTRTHLLWAQ